MTITLHWWVLPLLLLAVGIAVPAMLKTHGDWDMVTPLLRLAIFCGCALGALGIVVGRWLS